LAGGADVLIHEVTNTFLPGVDKDGNMKVVTRDAKIHGHSTLSMVR
jgi:ribonuclease Z